MSLGSSSTPSLTFVSGSFSQITFLQLRISGSARRTCFFHISPYSSPRYAVNFGLCSSRSDLSLEILLFHPIAEVTIGDFVLGQPLTVFPTPGFPHTVRSPSAWTDPRLESSLRRWVAQQPSSSSRLLLAPVLPPRIAHSHPVDLSVSNYVCELSLAFHP